MAKKFRKNAVKKKDNGRYILIGVFVVVITMLFSGLYFSSERNSPKIPNEVQPEPWVDKYQISQIGNFSIIVRIAGIANDLIVMPDSRCVYFETINEIQNISAGNFKGIEVAEPATASQPAPMICGFYTLFKFGPEEGGNPFELNGEIKQKLGKSSTLQGYIANLPINISGTDQVYVVGQPGNEVGDYLRIVLYQKIAFGIESGMIGFGERKIPVGPVLPATVVNITDIIVQGTVNTDLPPDIHEKLNETEFNFLPPKIMINETIENKTADRLMNLTGVSVLVNSEENRTEISFNSSKRDILEILNKEGIDYSLQDGGVMFKIPLNSDIGYVMKTLADNNILDIRLGKEGAVSLTTEFILENNVVPIRNSDRFNAVLEMDREIDEKINVTINTIRFGEQIIAFSASEIRGD